MQEKAEYLYVPPFFFGNKYIVTCLITHQISLKMTLYLNINFPQSIFVFLTHWLIAIENVYSGIRRAVHLIIIIQVKLTFFLALLSSRNYSKDLAYIHSFNFHNKPVSTICIPTFIWGNCAAEIQRLHKNVITMPLLNKKDANN